MKIAIVGGGITGLAAAYRLSQQGHAVSLFEKESYLGGLAYGFTSPGWDWHIEGAYHHLFTNDRSIISFINELGLSEKLIVKRPITASLWNDRMYQLDSPQSLFTFPGLSITDKLRTALLLGIVKLTPFWQPFESFTAEQFIVSIGGKQAFQTIWKPLLYGKFSSFAPRLAASWFWARIKKRTPRLCYIDGGFHTLVEALEKTITGHGGNILTSTAVTSIKKGQGKSYIVSLGENTKQFDKVLLTIPTPFALSLLPKYDRRNPIYDAFRAIPHLSAQTLILETKEPILRDVYWLNITDQSFPFLAAVAHTNFMDKKHYGNRHLTYFGNYLPEGHPYLSMTKTQLFNTFFPFLTKLNPSLKKGDITRSFLFTAPFAQPVHTLHYSKKIPPIKTPIPHIYLANMDMVHPWDRGTNYAVELGLRAADVMCL